MKEVIGYSLLDASTWCSRSALLVIGYEEEGLLSEGDPTVPLDFALSWIRLTRSSKSPG